jgi:hypothetical protein
MYKILLSLALLILSIYSIYRGIRSIRTRNLYWAGPTISGFKKRKEEKSPPWVAVLTGLSTITFGLFLLYSSIMIFIHAI